MRAPAVKLLLAVLVLASAVFPQTLGLVPPTLPNGTVDQTYNTANTPFLVPADGNLTPSERPTVSGPLPPGVSLTTTAPYYLNGIPSAGGNFNFTVTAKFFDTTATRAYIVRILGIITQSPLRVGTVGSPYLFQLGALGIAGTPLWTLTGGTLPNGLTLSSDGTIQGIPTVAQTFTFTVSVTDTGRTHSRTFSITISPPLVISPPSGSRIPPGAQAQAPHPGEPFTFPFAGTGGNPPYRFVMTPENVNGLTMNADGVLSGTVINAGTFPFDVSLEDQGGTGALVSGTYTLNTFGITTSSLPVATVGVDYNATLQAAGFIGTLSWTSTPNVPAGLALSTAGAITGTPTQSGVFPIAFHANEGSTGNVANRTLNLQVNAGPLTITTASPLPTGNVGTPYSVTFAASGGVPPYTAWSFVSGALPPGVSLNVATGVLSGTPTTVGTSTFTVRVTDSAQVTATKEFTVTINAANQPLTIVTSALPSGLIGQPYGTTIDVSGGKTPYTLTIATGSLPPGVSINGLTITGTPTATGTFTFTLRVTDTNTPQGSVTKDLFIVIGANPASNVTLNLSVNNPPAATQPSVTVTRTNTSAAITGTLTITFAPTGGADDQRIVFSNGTRTATFSLAAGAASSAAIQFGTGTTAGIITIRATVRDANNVDITPSPAPTTTVTITGGRPVITGARINTVVGGFNIVVNGYSTTRDMTNVVFHFVATTGTVLSANDVTVNVAQAFSTYYATPASQQTGSLFTMTAPFTFSGTSFPVAAMTLEMTNSQGTSATFGPVNPQ